MDPNDTKGLNYNDIISDLKQLVQIRQCYLETIQLILTEQLKILTRISSSESTCRMSVTENPKENQHTTNTAVLQDNKHGHIKKSLDSLLLYLEVLEIKSKCPISSKIERV